MVPLLTFLREAEAVPAPPVEALLEQYRRWMESERGLSASTILRYENAARRFLTQQAIIDGRFHAGGSDRG